MFKVYPVSDVWLATTDPKAPDYCDIDEIRNDPRNNVPQPDNALNDPVNYPESAYLTWVLANDPTVFTKLDGTAATMVDHKIAARFKDGGTKVGNTDGGNRLKGVIKDMAVIVIGEFFGGINHEEVFRRIYRDDTQVRKIWFLGY